MNPMSQVQISLIVPIYQSKAALHSCLDSLKNQDFQERYEILLVPFGSTDGSEEVCEEYARSYPDLFRVYPSEKNYGVSASRNVGLLLSRGKYVAFVDSDDELSPNFLSFLYAKAEKSMADIVSCGFYMYGPTKHLQWARIRSKTTGRKALSRFLSFRGLNLRAYCWGRLYRRDFLLREKIRFPSELGLYEDWVFFVRCLMKADRVEFYRKPLYHYCQRTPSLTHSRKDFAASFTEALKRILREVSAEDPSYFLSLPLLSVSVKAHLYWACKETEASFRERYSVRKKELESVWKEERKNAKERL